MRPADPDYPAAVRQLCDERGVLLIVDEIQTGFGRCGKMFASDVYGIQPDIMAVSKAMAGGVPMGGVLCNEKISSAAGKHGSTFGGNPLAAAACIATIDYLVEHKLPGHAEILGQHFKQHLQQDQPEAIREVRQLGLMIGIELKTKSRPVLERMMSKGVLALPAGPTVVRLLPPLTITLEDLNRVISVLRESIE